MGVPLNFHVLDKTNLIGIIIVNLNFFITCSFLSLFKIALFVQYDWFVILQRCAPSRHDDVTSSYDQIMGTNKSCYSTQLYADTFAE